MKNSKTEGWYTFADGYRCWFLGLSVAERKVQEKYHGKLVKFERTAYQMRGAQASSLSCAEFFGRIPSEIALAFHIFKCYNKASNKSREHKREVQKMLNIRTLEKMPYANAKVYVEDNGNIALVSYHTTVAVIDNEGWLTVNGTYSATTRKHLSAFMHEYGNGYGYYDAKSAFLNSYELNLNTGEMRVF